MHPSDPKISRFIQLANEAIATAQQERNFAARNDKSWLVEDCDLAIANFRFYREQALSGQLPASNGAGLGITRALSEWGVSDTLYSAGKALEDYYSNEYGA